MLLLGRPLVFYLKYMAEMNRLYDPDGEAEIDLTGLEDAHQVCEMSRTVGAAAYEQVADFLELCESGFNAHFAHAGLATLTAKRKRRYVSQTWGSDARFDVPLIPGGWFSCGAHVTAPPEINQSLPPGACGFVIPWVWAKGGRRGAEAIWKILGGWAHSRGGEGVIDGSGAVALACVPIRPSPPNSYEVDRDQLVSEVVATVARIGPKEVKAIATFVAALSGPDENE